MGHWAQGELIVDTWHRRRVDSAACGIENGPEYSNKFAMLLSGGGRIFERTQSHRPAVFESTQSPRPAVFESAMEDC